MSIDNKEALLDELDEITAALDLIKASLSGDAAQYEFLINELLRVQADVYKTIGENLL